MKQTLTHCGQLFGENTPEAYNTTACLEKLTSSDSTPDSSRKRRSEVSDDEELWDEGEFELGSGDFEEGSGDYPEPTTTSGTWTTSTSGAYPDLGFGDPVPCSELATIPCDDIKAGEGDIAKVNQTVEETSEEFVDDFKRMSDADSNPIERWCPEPGSSATSVFKVRGEKDGEWLSIIDGELSYELSITMCDTNNGLHHRALTKIAESAEIGEKSDKKSSKKSKRAVKESLKEIKDLPVKPEKYADSEKDMKKALKKFAEYEEAQLKSATATASEKLGNIKQHLNRDYSGCPEMTIEEYLANYEEMCPNCKPDQATYAECKAKDPCHCNFKQFDKEIKKTEALKAAADSLAAKFQPELDDLLSKESGITD